MMIQALTTVSLLMLICLTSLVGQIRHTHARLDRQVAAVMNLAVGQARAYAVDSVVAYAQTTGGDTSGYTPPTNASSAFNLCPQTSQAGCRFTMTATIGLGSGGSGASAAFYNGNSSLNERRISLVVTTNVHGPTGPQARTEVVQIQTFVSTPNGTPVQYGRLVGVLDASSGTQIALVGANAGCAGTGAGCDAQASTATGDANSADSRLHSYQTCDDTGPTVCPVATRTTDSFANGAYNGPDQGQGWAR